MISVFIARAKGTPPVGDANAVSGAGCKTLKYK
jgi:hypothetical protein